MRAQVSGPLREREPGLRRAAAFADGGHVHHVGSALLGVEALLTGEVVPGSLP